MRRIFSGHRNFWTREHRRSLYLGLLLLIVALALHVQTGHYTARVTAHAPFVGDIILDNIPAVNLDFIVVQGAVLFWVLVLALLLARPRYLLFGIKAVALFIIARSFFVTLTHVGVYPTQVPVDGDEIGSRLYDLFTFQGNFFFSGHTGLPFLMMLIFWNDKPWRWFFLAATVVFGASVLLAHVHYSIDVMSAPFITYGIFKIGEKLFRHDFLLISGAEPSFE